MGKNVEINTMDASHPHCFVLGAVLGYFGMERQGNWRSTPWVIADGAYVIANAWYLNLWLDVANKLNLISPIAEQCKHQLVLYIVSI